MLRKPARRADRNWSHSVDYVDWDLAIAHYDADRLEQAYEMALDVGMGRVGQYLHWFRTIEAEYLTREKSTKKLIQSFFELEWVPDELEGQEDFVATVALEAFQNVGSRFGYNHESKVLVAVLASETNAPWLYGRFGYCIAKVPYYKICVPLNLIGRRQELYNTLRHEYAHVVVGTLAKNRAPRWIDEAVAMLSEGGVSKAHARPFVNGEEEWLGPKELESDLRDLEEGRDRWLAYVQSGLIGMYLAKTYGEASVGTLLRGFLPNPSLKELVLRLRGKEIEDGAIRRAFGIRLDELFEKSGQWVRAGRAVSL